MYLESKGYGMEGTFHNYRRTEHCGKSYQQLVISPFLHNATKESFDATIADIGAGSGEFSQQLFKLSRSNKVARVINIDAVSLGLRQISSEKINNIQSDASRLPFQSDVFDGIHMKDALVHIYDKDTLFAEFFRIMKSRAPLVMAAKSTDTMYFTYGKNDQETWNNAESFKVVESYEEYKAEGVRLTKEGNLVSQLYVPFDNDEVVAKAKQNNFRLIRLSHWKQPLNHPDWYLGDRSVIRTVFWFQKQ